MALSKKNYEAVADILRVAADVHDMDIRTIGAIATMLADYFQSDNDRFDRDRFMRAAFGEGIGFATYKAERERLGL